MRIRTLFLLLFFTLLTGNLPAQNDTGSIIVESPVVDTTYTTDEEEDSEVVDTALISEVAHFPNDSILTYKKQKDFAYMRNIDSLLKKLQDEELRKKKKEPRRIIVNPLPFLRLPLWGIAISVVLFVIYRLFLGRNGMFAAPVKNKKLEIQEEELTDENYIDQQLREAIAAGNYRLAIRYLYLQTLSKLADKGWLQLSPDKTNYQYVKELTNKNLKNEFARVTLHYEYAWYGDFLIDRELFYPVQKEFQDFQNQVKEA